MTTTWPRAITSTSHLACCGRPAENSKCAAARCLGAKPAPTTRFVLLIASTIEHFFSQRTHDAAIPHNSNRSSFFSSSVSSSRLLVPPRHLPLLATMKPETGLKRTGGDQSPIPHAKRTRFIDDAVIPILRDVVDELCATRSAPVEVAPPTTTVPVDALRAGHLAILDAIEKLHRSDPFYPGYTLKPSQHASTFLQLADNIHDMDPTLTAIELQDRRLLLFIVETAMMLGLVPLACTVFGLIERVVTFGSLERLRSLIVNDGVVELLLPLECTNSLPKHKSNTQAVTVAARSALTALFRRVGLASRDTRRQAVSQLLMCMQVYAKDTDRGDIDKLYIKYLLDMVNANDDTGTHLLGGYPTNGDAYVRDILEAMVRVAGQAGGGRLEAIHNACTLLSTLAHMAKATSANNAWPSWIVLFDKACRQVLQTVRKSDVDELEALTVTLMMNKATLSPMQ